MNIHIGHLLLIVGAIITWAGGLIIWQKSNVDLLTAKSELAKMSHYVLSNVTGGNSYCYLDIVNIDEKNGKGMGGHHTEGRISPI